MLTSLKIYPILAGARGQAGVNLEALLDLMLALSRLAVRLPGNPGIGPQPGGCRPPGLLVRRLADGYLSFEF